MVGIDKYSLQARLFPAILAAAPALAFVLANVAATWDALGLPQAVVTLTITVLFFAFADLSRRLGRRLEKEMFKSSNGRPFATVLRHRDQTIDKVSKARYHTFLAKQISMAMPSEEDEITNPVQADSVYAIASTFLRERTRDQSKFQVLFAENIVYGFRRNLRGLKWVGLFINVVVSVTSALLIYKDSSSFPLYSAVLAISAIHAVYFLFAVTMNSVREASTQYGRQLVLASETLKGDRKSKKSKA